MDMIDRLDKILDERGIDQAELESSAALSHGRISKWKRGTGEPSAAQAARIARELGVSLEWLVEGVGDAARANRDAGLSPDEVAVLGLIRGMRLTVGEAAARLAPKSARKPRRSPRRRRQG